MESINDLLFENLKQHKISQLNKILGGEKLISSQACTGGTQYDTGKWTSKEGGDFPDMNNDWGDCIPQPRIATRNL